MCESAVFSVAAVTVSLPLSGIWWSIYRMNVGSKGGECANGFSSADDNIDRKICPIGSISWSPEVTGELICALLGLPVVLLGLGLLVRSHFRDNQSSYQTLPTPEIQPEQGQR